ncbi:MAG: undecaprenyldiphospho-muramoylpentapeptide beta-N-acetylglucosaminyltransferase [Candidatus Poribacteria bacterium]|nr:undecaprenyldiphospho-muramoylpentapeptide beta-N-acetylglucosaminyltransferase [Candidatus Poribacteria bacterium]MDE0505244.1 undecaprenyldiphospho-muramoylpentapeptide beta-N-acetylglucosaminyltransferase [Candidatus Poribacteria bacterium]
MPLIVISGGGTGGHIYPAVGLAQAIVKIEPDIGICFIGGADRLESKIVPQHGFRFLPISVAGFPRKLTWKWFSVIGKACRGFAQSLQFIGRLKPSVVVGTGGYVSGPVLFAASRLGIPTAIQEQNASAGLTNRILARWATMAYLAFPSAANGLSADIVKITGNPIRPQIVSFTRSPETYKKLGLDPDRKTIFVMGGSQGANAINQIVIKMLPELAHLHKHLQLVHQTGETDLQQVKGHYDGSPMKHVVQPYFDPIGEIYSISDLMVCRAGGMTISEITACGLPAIFIPLPSTPGNNQELNAQVVSKSGAGVVVNQQTLTGQLLAEQITGIIGNPNKQKQMSDASRKFGNPHASEEIAKFILSLAHKGLKAKIS